MRNTLKIVTAAVLTVVVAAFASDAWARGGGGGRGGGGRGGGGRGGAGRGGPGRGGAGPSTRGGANKNAGGMKGKTASDYLDQDQREAAEAGLPEFLLRARYGSLTQAAEDERDAALRSRREKASADRRTASERGSHPL